MSDRGDVNEVGEAPAAIRVRSEELVRTGAVVMRRGSSSIEEAVKR